MSLITAEKREGLRDRFRLHLPRLCSVLVLLIHALATLLQIREKCSVRGQSFPSVPQISFRLRILLVSVGRLLGLSVKRVLASLDLFCLGSLQALIVAGGSGLLLLSVREVGLEAFLHLLKNTKDLAGRRGSRLGQGE